MNISSNGKPVPMQAFICAIAFLPSPELVAFIRRKCGISGAAAISVRTNRQADPNVADLAY